MHLNGVPVSAEHEVVGLLVNDMYVTVNIYEIFLEPLRNECRVRGFQA